MIVLGLDVATSTGFCFLDSSRPPSGWRFGAVACDGENGEDKAGDLAVALHGLVKEHRPDFCAMEMPQRSVVMFRKRGAHGEETPEQTINPHALQLSALAGGVAALLDLCGVPWGLIAPSGWRSSYFGKGVKPPTGKDWKDIAIRSARMQGMQLPATLKAQRDAAEAVGIASAWQRCTSIPARHLAAFTALRVAGRARP